MPLWPCSVHPGPWRNMGRRPLGSQVAHFYEWAFVFIENALLFASTCICSVSINGILLITSASECQSPGALVSAVDRVVPFPSTSYGFRYPESPETCSLSARTIFLDTKQTLVVRCPCCACSWRELGSVPSTHTLVQEHWWLQFQEISTVLWPPQDQVPVWSAHISAGKTLTHMRQ